MQYKILHNKYIFYITILEMKKTVWWAIFFIIFLLVWASIVDVYFANHQYYATIFSSWKHRQILIVAIVSACIPVAYLLFQPKKSLWMTIVTVFAGLLVFSFFHQWLKWGIIWPSWAFMTIINTAILFGVSVYFLVWLLGVWTVIEQKFIRFSEHRFQEMFFSFGIGLAAFLFYNHFLIIGWIYFPLFSWVFFVGLWVCIRYQKKQLMVYAQRIKQSCLDLFSANYVLSNGWYIFGAILLLLSIMYYYFWFSLSFVPYSTAWDANHLYMYCPKVFAENFWATVDVCWTSPMLWLSYISFWFSLIEPIKWRFRIAPSTFGVALNFLSGIMVLLFAIAVGSEIGSLLTVSSTNKNLSLQEKDTETLKKTVLTYTSWTTILLWLSSGMWAFLVFIDNKSDLWVMALTLLAILSWIIFLTQVQNKTEWSKKYVLLSGFFFALATMWKVTALQDVLLFWFLLVAFWMNAIVAIGLWIASLWVLWYLNILTVAFFIPHGQASFFIGIGLIIAIIWVAYFFVDKRWREKLLSLRYIAIRGITVLLCLIILKTPQVLYTQIRTQTLSPSWFAKWILMSVVPHNAKNSSNKKNISDPEEDRPLLAWNLSLGWFKSTYVTPEELAEVAPHLSIYCSPERNIEDAQTVALSPKQCRATYGDLSEEELFSWLQKTVGWWLNEDFQRYIWFGQREFSAPLTPSLQAWQTRLGYMLDTIGYSFADVLVGEPWCYGRNTDAKTLCQNKDTIQQFNIPQLRSLLATLPKQSEGHLLLSCILGKGTNKTAYPQFSTAYWVQALQSFYKDSVVEVTQKSYFKNDPSKICTTNSSDVCFTRESIAIPYRYIVPLNVTVINSLQNLSSYYTDVWYVFFILLILVIVGTVYLLFFLRVKKWTYYIYHPYVFTFSIHIIALLWWIIRRAIGSAILWYWVGLIAWTIAANTSLFACIMFRKQNIDTYETYIRWAVLWLLWTFIGIQFVLNFVRISSQWWEFNFVRYKWSSANINTYQVSQWGIIPKTSLQIPYTADDVFDLQFGHYNAFIDAVKNRKDDEGVLIAWTYLQYFLDNQHNIISDSLLSQLWEWTSDNNLCKSRLRLEEKNIKYIVIDPNILTVVMWWWNNTLKDRMFAKIDSANWQIKNDGTMTILAKMVQAWYGRLMYSNSLLATYAFDLTDQQLQEALSARRSSNPSDQVALTLAPLEQDMSLLRAYMSLARFFPEYFGSFMQLSAQIFEQRLISSIDAIQDISWVFWRTVDSEKIYRYYTLLQQQGLSPTLADEMNRELTSDELFVLSQYAQLRYLIQTWNTQSFQEAIGSLLNQSVQSSSQLIVFELL